MSLALFAPTRALGHADELPLGARVSWTHRAAVARWSRRDRAEYWALVEGIETRGGWRPYMSSRPERPDNPDSYLGFDYDPDPFYSRKPQYNEPNKTVFVWPEEGEGIVIGLVRRSIGRSWGASGGGGSYFGEDNYEPGGHASDCTIPLYAVKVQLTGLGYSLVPHWAVTPR